MEAVPPSATTIFLERDELHETVSGLEAAGITFEHPPVDQPWPWREAAYAIRTAIGCAYSMRERTASIHPGGFPADGVTGPLVMLAERAAAAALLRSKRHA
jgi:hypothetical protein